MVVTPPLPCVSCRAAFRLSPNDEGIPNDEVISSDVHPNHLYVYSDFPTVQQLMTGAICARRSACGCANPARCKALSASIGLACCLTT